MAHRRGFRPNASGKSNLLDAIRFVHDIVSFGGGFEEAVGKRGGVSKLRCLAARRYPDVAIQVHIAENDGGLVWEYELHFAQDNLRRPFIRKERIVKSGTQVLSRPNQDDKRAAEARRRP